MNISSVRTHESPLCRTNIIGVCATSRPAKWSLKTIHENGFLSVQTDQTFVLTDLKFILMDQEFVLADKTSILTV